MIHNKYFSTISQFLGDYNKEVHGRGLVKKINLSQKAIALTLDELEKQGILKSRKEGNMKYFRLNTDNPQLNDVLLSAEIMKKMQFFEKHRKIANIFKQDTRIVGIFGSYASEQQTKTSDIDIFIIGDKKANDYDKQGKIYDLDISIKYFKENDFTKNNLVKEIVSNHVLIAGAEQFINLIRRRFYGFT